MWLPSQLHAAFAADGLRICTVDTMRRKARDYSVISVASAAMRSGDAPWQPWVDALADWLGERSGRRFDLRVVLSDAFVRYQLLPWQAGISGNSEWRSYAGYRFREVYGDRAAGWSTQVATTPPGETALATAIDAPLLDALRALPGKPSKLVSVQPRFVAGYNQWRRKLRGRNCWFGSSELGRVCLGFIDKGRWMAIRNETCDELSVQGMAEILHRLELTLDESAKVAPLYFSGQFADKTEPTVIGGHVLHHLQVPSCWSPERRQLAMAKGW